MHVYFDFCLTIQKDHKLAKTVAKIQSAIFEGCAEVRALKKCQSYLDKYKHRVQGVFQIETLENLHAVLDRLGTSWEVGSFSYFLGHTEHSRKDLSIGFAMFEVVEENGTECKCSVLLE